MRFWSVNICTNSFVAGLKDWKTVWTSRPEISVTGDLTLIKRTDVDYIYIRTELIDSINIKEVNCDPDRF